MPEQDLLGAACIVIMAGKTLFVINLNIYSLKNG